MKRTLALLAVSFLVLARTTFAVPAPTAAHLDDSAHVLAADAAWAQTTETKLAAFEREHGVKVIVRFHAKSPSDEEDKVPGAYMRALSARLGTTPRGVLLVYFADDPDWRMWLSDDLTAKFVGKPGTATALTESGAIHDAKESFFRAAEVRRDATFAELQKTAPAGHPPTAAQKLALHTGALLDALIVKLGAK